MMGRVDGHLVGTERNDRSQAWFGWQWSTDHSLALTLFPEAEGCNLYGWARYRPSSPHSRSLSGSTRRTSSSEGFRPPTIMTPSI